MDRDPPQGRDLWRVKVQVRDGQRVSPSLAAAATRASRRPRLSQPASQGHLEDTETQYTLAQGFNTFSKSKHTPDSNRKIKKQYHFPQAHYNSQEGKHGMHDLDRASQIKYFRNTKQKLPEHRYASRDQILLSSATVKKVKKDNGGEEGEEKELTEKTGIEERIEGEEAFSRKLLKMKVLNGVRDANRVTFLANEKNGVGSVKTTNNEDRTNQERRYVRKEQYISKNQWNTEQKFLDKMSRISKDYSSSERILRTVISKQTATGRMKRREVDSSKGKYTPFISCSSDERKSTKGNQWMRETKCHLEHHRKFSSRNEDRTKLRRAKYSNFKKHQQSGFQRKLLSLRGRPVLHNEDLRKKTESEDSLFTLAEQTTYHGPKIFLANNGTLSAHFISHVRDSAKTYNTAEFIPSEEIHLVWRDQPKYDPLLSNDAPSSWFDTRQSKEQGSLSSNETISITKSNPDQMYLDQLRGFQENRHKRGIREGIMNLLKSSETQTYQSHVSRRKRDPKTNQFTRSDEAIEMDRIILTQLGEDLVYVRRYKAIAGRCDASSNLPVTSKEKEKKDQPDDQKVNEKEWWQMVQTMMKEMRREQVHVAETVVTVVVKDINDNAPVFPNTTMFGEVQENGPIGEFCILAVKGSFEELLTA